MQRPQLKKIEDIDFTRLKAILEEYLDECERGDEDTDTDHFIMEEVVSAFYGKDVWKYVNQAYLAEEEDDE